MVPGAGLEPAHLSARDFKSLVSTYFTIRADVSIIQSLELFYNLVITISCFSVDRRTFCSVSYSLFGQLSSFFQALSRFDEFVMAVNGGPDLIQFPGHFVSVGC